MIESELTSILNWFESGMLSMDEAIKKIVNLLEQTKEN